MKDFDCQRHAVVFEPLGRRGYIRGGETIKEAARSLAVNIEGICGEKASCGKCKVRIEKGYFKEYGIESLTGWLSPISDIEKKLLSPQQEHDDYRLACQARIHGDIVVFVPEESRVDTQIVRKAVMERASELRPAVMRYYVEMVEATLHDTLGDWERLQAKLIEMFALNNLTIDYWVLLSLQKVIRLGNWKVTVSVWMDKEVIKIEPGLVDGGYGLAVDIGTTTVAGYLCDLTNGEMVATDSTMNPQVVHGEDVMSRISYTMANEDGLEKMNQMIIRSLNQMVGRIVAQVGIEHQDITDMTIVGNTSMHHIFLNIDPQYAGKAPFPPSIHHSLDIKARDLGLKISSGAYVHILPIEAGFVGADNVGVLIAEEPYNQDDIMLIIDIGTNGELILGNRDNLTSCSCATGPAFEGAKIKYGMRAVQGAIEKINIDPYTREVYFKVIGKEDWNTELTEVEAKGICGSGIIDAVSMLLLVGMIDHTGRFRIDLPTPRLRITENGPEFVIAWAEETVINQDIVVCQEDIRNIQLAKAAVYAGAKVMMHRLGIKKLSKVILAGAFGNCINKESAATIGLFPDCSLKNIYSVGNAAGDGARLALLSVEKRAEADEIARRVEYVELTVDPNFEGEFFQAMHLPHMKDTFPHLRHILPGKAIK